MTAVLTAAIANPAQPVTPVKTVRLASVDVLRGFVMVTMIFVNDVAGVRGAPAWMKHIHPSDANGMTFVDWVFPAFLFVVGLSLPVAIENRRRKGDGDIKILFHAVVRTLSLLLMGVFMVNIRKMDKWALLVFVAGVMAFLSAPRWPKWVVISIRVLGFALFAGLWWRYEPLYGQPMKTSWWGILGLIGWAYLVAVVVYIVTRGSRAGMAAGVGVLIGLYFANGEGKFGSPLDADWLGWVRSYVNIGQHLGSHAAITVSGAIVGTSLARGAPEQTHAARVRFALLVMVPLLLGALVTYNAYGINKNAATPAWCLLCAGITAGCFVVAYLLTDAIGRSGWAWVLAGCGANALLAYLSQSLFIRTWSMLGWKWLGPLGDGVWVNVGMSVGIAVVLATVAAGLNAVGVRLKL